ncbi:MAG: AAA family ATPase, partial [Candidatus Hydrothermarchaeota archaeon]
IIEVTYELDQEHVKKTKRAMEELKQRNGLIITWDEEDVIKENNREIKILPLWKFLTTM